MLFRSTFGFTMPVIATLAATVATSPALAARIGPPMFDITGQCDASHPHNADAMSECVVAESEARTQILQNWSKYSDAGAEKCIAAGRKAKRLPYTAMVRCMSVETSAGAAPATGRK